MPFTAAALRLSAGVIVWALHFAAIYGYTGIACARRFHAYGETLVAAVPWVIGIATASAIAAVLPLVAQFARVRTGSGFIDWMSGGLAALSLVAIVFEAMTVIWLPACT